MKQHITLIAAALALTGCLTRAPTDYELDRRAGLTPPETDPKKKDAELAKFSFEKRARAARVPGGYEKRIEKTWLYERNVGGGTLQSTWYWMGISSSGCNCDAPYQSAKQKEVTQGNRLQNQKH